LRDPLAERLCGFGVWTPKGYDWVWRRFVADAVNGYQCIKAPAFENRHILDKIGDFYERLEKSYDMNFYEQEVLGNYLSMDGSRVYSSFDRAMHLKTLTPNPAAPLLWALDFNVDPMSSVIAQMGGGVMRVLDEIVLRHATTRQACIEFLKRYPQHPGGVCVYGDASGSAQQTTGMSDYELVREYFMANSRVTVDYRVPKSNPPVRERVNLVNRLFLSAAGQVAVQVDPKCKELIKDLEQVCYKADSMVIDKDRDRARTHVSDALGYLMWQECRPQPTIGERGEALI
jgi:hypothetical protein